MHQIAGILYVLRSIGGVQGGKVDDITVIVAYVGKS